MSAKYKHSWNLPVVVLIGLPAGLTCAQDGPNSSLYSGQMQARQQMVRFQQQPEYDPTQSPAPPAPGPNSPFAPNNGGSTPAPTLAYGQMGAPLATNWYEIPLPPPREAKVHDIITIRVDLGARVTSEGDFQRRKNANYDAILKDWLMLDGLRWVKPAPQSDGDQRVQGTFNTLSRSQSDLETAESMKFDIASKVAAILPNGTLVLEAHREVRSNSDTWLVSLSGVCRREDIQPGNVILSKDIAELKIDKRELGSIRDSYKRGWFTRWLDTFNPW